MEKFDANEFGYDAIYNNTEQRIKKHLKEILPEEAYFKWVDNFVFEVIGDKKIVIAYVGDEPLKEFNKTYKETVSLHICSVVGYVKIKYYQKKKPAKSSKASKNIYKEPRKPVVPGFEEVNDVFDEADIRDDVPVFETEEEKVILPDEEIFAKPAKKAKKIRENTKGTRNLKVAKLFVVSIFFIGITLLLILVGSSYVSNRSFRETFYSVSSLKANDKVRIIQISDIHGTEFGSGNEKLVDRVEKLKPDIIIFTGDCIGDGDVSETVKFCAKVAKFAPVYYIYGNNEVEKYYDFELNQDELDKKFGFNNYHRDPSILIEKSDKLEDELEKIGVKVLKNEVDTVTVGTTDIDVYGVLTSNPSAFWSYGGESFVSYLEENERHIKVTAIHEPVVFSEFSPDFWGDISLSGHTHGGFIKVPLLGPLYTHEGGLFPGRKGDLVYGRYEVAGRPVIVSAGLDNENFFRINNKPELVIIDINRF